MEHDFTLFFYSSLRFKIVFTHSASNELHTPSNLES